MKCKICGGHAEPLGSLGLLMHYRCRNCGMMFTRRLPRKPQRKIPGAPSIWKESK